MNNNMQDGKECSTSHKERKTRQRRWKDLFRYVKDEDRDEPGGDEFDSAPVSWGSIVKFWQFVRPHKNLVVVLFAFSLLNQAMSVVMPVAIGRILDYVLPRHDDALLTQTALLMVGFLLLRSLFLFCERELSVRAGWKVVLNVRRRLYAHMQSMSLRFLEEYQVGRILARIVGDTESLRHLLLGGFINSAANLVRFMLVLGVLFWIDWRMTLITSFTLPLFLFGFSHYIRKLRYAYREMNEDGSNLWADANETFAATRIVKTYRGERRANGAFIGKVHEIMRKALLIDRAQHFMAVIWEATACTGLIALIWYGGWRVQQGLMTPGEFFAFYGLLGQVQGPIADLINISGNIQHSLASIARVTALLKMKPEIADRPDAIDCPDIAGDIEFRNVCFSYEKNRMLHAAGHENSNGNGNGSHANLAHNRKTINNINFSMRAGEFIAIVGPSGSGKSTLINLVARLYDIDSGAILVDGVDIRDYRISAYRSHLAIVLQDSILFRGSIRDNIRYARPDATEAEVLNAAKMANAWEFISKLDEGLDAYCGERGMKFSGGQKQRISIARAILANPRILMLDEATSALDSEAEAGVQEALSHLMKGRTTIVVAHRLSTIVHADRIIVLRDGTVVETGNHEHLMTHEGEYYDMFMEQYGKMRGSRRLHVPGR
jgi:ABC-type multidrug transport system fused ATPase/permease subunit